MRVLIDLPKEQLAELARLGEARKRSRAAVVREAVGEYLKGRRTSGEANAFGLWGKQKVDGLKYQQKLRREW